MAKTWYIYLLWVLAAGVLGFAASAVFSTLLKLPRGWLLLPYTLLSGGFVYAFFRWSALDVRGFIAHYWWWGVIGAVAVSVFLVRNVLSQPASAPSQGLALAFDVLWLGVVYGAIDALLLSVLPVVATWQAFATLGWTATWPGKLGVGAAALVASLLVTAAYHVGYVEFQGPEMAGPVVGNGVMSLGMLVTGNPIAAVGSHVAMHTAAVLHGPATTIQLPPHY